MTKEWIQTFTGAAFHLEAPKPEEIRLIDICHSLACQCRFNGHCAKFYSVAEHSVQMAIQAPIEYRKEILLHDAAEAYLGDMVRPLKAKMPHFVELETKIMGAIAEKYELDFGSCQEIIDDLDLRMLATEADQLMFDSPHSWGCLDGVEPFDIKLEGWYPDEAERKFFAAWLFIITKKQISFPKSR